MTVDQLLDRALQLHQSGRLVEAEGMYRQVLVSRPDHADALHSLGLLEHQKGHADVALKLLRKAIAVKPRAAEFQIDLAAVLISMDRFEEAADACRRALSLKPDSAEAHYNLGILLTNLKRGEEALASFRQALRYKPDFAEAHNGLGTALKEMGQPKEAAASFRQALSYRPQFAEAINNLGNALSAMDRPAEALIAFAKARDLQPENPHIYYNAGNVLKDLGRLEQSVDAYRRALAIKPDYAEAYGGLGATLNKLGQSEQAEEAFREACAIKPDYLEAYNNLGNTLKDLGRLQEAMETLQKVTAIHPHYAPSYNNLAIVLMKMGRHEESLETYRRAVELGPRSAMAHSNYIFSLHYLHGNDGAIVLQEARRWDAQHAEPLRKSLAAHTNNRDPGRRLRIGYISCDFREHSVSRFLHGLFENHDHERYEIVCYCDVRRPDSTTDRLRACADAWHDILDVPDARVAELIRFHGVDILIDLTGHTGDNRLSALAPKPAPVQMTYLGYPGTTGLATMDYRLTDALANPPGMTDAYSTETLLRLPVTGWCFTPPPDIPDVAPSPAAQGRPLCFGSFNKLNKITPQTRDLWAAVLTAVPEARLILKDRALNDPKTRERMLQEFVGRGISPERLEFAVRQSDLASHVRVYGQVDIALDPFPYHGTATTCEALWMGVPVVTLAGATHVSRVGVSLLTNIGLPELIGDSPQDYVSIAAGLARNPSRLQELRSTMRRRMLSSPLMNGPQFARDVEAAYRDAWQRWCAKTGPYNAGDGDRRSFPAGI